PRGRPPLPTRRSSDLDAAMTRAVAAAKSWQSLGCDERSRILRHAAVRLEARRAELLEVMGSECGKTLDQGDPEISEAIDFVNLRSEEHTSELQSRFDL